MPAQLDKLKRRLGLESDNSKDHLLVDLIEDAELFVRNYTGRSEVPEALTGVVIDMAAGTYNLRGLEGSVSHSEGGVSDSIQLLSPQAAAQMNQWRRARVG